MTSQLGDFQLGTTQLGGPPYVAGTSVTATAHSHVEPALAASASLAVTVSADAVVVVPPIAPPPSLYQFGVWQLGAVQFLGDINIGGLPRTIVTARSVVVVPRKVRTWQLGVFQLGIWQLPWPDGVFVQPVEATSDVDVALAATGKLPAVTITSTSIVVASPSGIKAEVDVHSVVSIAITAKAHLAVPVQAMANVVTSLSATATLPATTVTDTSVVTVTVLPKVTTGLSGIDADVTELAGISANAANTAGLSAASWALAGIDAQIGAT